MMCRCWGKREEQLRIESGELREERLLLHRDDTRELELQGEKAGSGGLGLLLLAFSPQLSGFLNHQRGQNFESILKEPCMPSMSQNSNQEQDSVLNLNSCFHLSTFSFLLSPLIKSLKILPLINSRPGMVTFLEAEIYFAYAFKFGQRESNFGKVGTGTLGT